MRLRWPSWKVSPAPRFRGEAGVSADFFHRRFAGAAGMIAYMKEAGSITAGAVTSTGPVTSTGAVIIIEGKIDELPDMPGAYWRMESRKEEHDYGQWLLGIEFTEAIDARLKKREERRPQWTAKDKRNRRRMLRRTNHRRLRGKR